MYVKQVVFGLFCLSCCYCIRVWRHKSSCDRRGTGFTCLPKSGDKRTVIFECPSKTREYHIYINEFSGPKTLENLIIRNCNTLTILLRCTKYAWEKKNLKYLEISNIEKLKIQSVSLYQSLLPPTVVFENIKIIENIPGHTFTQTNKKLNVIRCVLPNYNFHSIHFRNVSINTVQAKAFYMPNSFGNVTFTNVRIRSLDTSSIAVDHAPKNVFLFEDSTVGVINPSAIQVVAPKVFFSKNRFSEIKSTGIRVTTDVFNFINNTIERPLHSEALSVTSQHVLVSTNHFRHLKTGAFSRMGGSENKFGSYKFVENVMDFIEDNSLLPKLHTYKNISFQTTIKRNTFSCECYMAGSLLMKMGKKSSHPTTDEFYKNVFEERSENVCSSSCSLPLYEAKQKIVQGKCTNNVTVANLCTARKKIEVHLVSDSPKTSTPSMSFKVSTHSFKSKLGNNKTISTITPLHKITPTSSTKLLPKENTSSPVTLSPVSASGSINNKSISNNKQTTLALPTTSSSVALTKTLPIIHTTSIYASSESSTWSTYRNSINDLLTLTTNKEDLNIKETSSPKVSSTIMSTEDNTSFSPITSTLTVTSSKENSSLSSLETSTGTVTSNNENTSFSSLETSSTLLQETTNNNSSTKEEITPTSSDGSTKVDYFPSLETSSYNLTTATISLTTVPTTKYKAATSNDSLNIFTPKYNDTRTVGQYVQGTTTPRQFSTLFYKKAAVTTTNSSVKGLLQNSSKSYVLSSSILILLVSVALNVS